MADGNLIEPERFIERPHETMDDFRQIIVNLLNGDLSCQYHFRVVDSKLKPRWDVHMAGGGDRYRGYVVALLLLIAGWSGSDA